MRLTNILEAGKHHRDPLQHCTVVCVGAEGERKKEVEEEETQIQSGRTQQPDYKSFNCNQKGEAASATTPRLFHWSCSRRRLVPLQNTTQRWWRRAASRRRALMENLLGKCRDVTLISMNRDMWDYSLSTPRVSSASEDTQFGKWRVEGEKEYSVFDFNENSFGFVWETLIRVFCLFIGSRGGKASAPGIRCVLFWRVVTTQKQSSAAVHGSRQKLGEASVARWRWWWQRGTKTEPDSRCWRSSAIPKSISLTGGDGAETQAFTGTEKNPQKSENLEKQKNPVLRSLSDEGQQRRLNSAICVSCVASEQNLQGGGRWVVTSASQLGCLLAEDSHSHVDSDKAGEEFYLTRGNFHFKGVKVERERYFPSCVVVPSKQLVHAAPPCDAGIGRVAKGTFLVMKVNRGPNGSFNSEDSQLWRKVNQSRDDMTLQTSAWTVFEASVKSLQLNVLADRWIFNLLLPSGVPQGSVVYFIWHYQCGKHFSCTSFRLITAH